MSKEEEKLDIFLKNLIQEEGLESPPSDDYINEVMLKIALDKNKGWLSKKMVIILGVLVYAILGVSIYFFSQGNWIPEINPDFNLDFSEWINTITAFISLKKLGFIAVGLVFYLLVVRSILVLFFMQKRQSMGLGINHYRSHNM